MSDQNNSGSDRPGFLQVLKSILAGLFGVQSHANRERDFNKGNPGDYIGVYVILVLGLVIGVFVVVKMVLSAAGS
ncbi:hypothetical protein MA04_02546 [Alcanivorax balearicus MACL04]|uniref:DUF2970 domain-containing protein n=1 Tax=Alloalcanivorax balearicus MACL04 TaxID=1177182 RepID=A0ABT2R0F9_9GAMM|nr:DUF2970 domain-containing protein [Alloalcanivorax balearicus]MCU5783246.1 hypothetical protein [Alloalcanivorax balearicus MACL04]